MWIFNTWPGFLVIWLSKQNSNCPLLQDLCVLPSPSSLKLKSQISTLSIHPPSSHITHTLSFPPLCPLLYDVRTHETGSDWTTFQVCVFLWGENLIHTFNSRTNNSVKRLHLEYTDIFITDNRKVQYEHFPIYHPHLYSLSHAPVRWNFLFCPNSHLKRLGPNSLSLA